MILDIDINASRNRKTIGMAESMNIIELKNKGITPTKHTMALLGLFNMHKHLDANQIFSLLQYNGVEVSVATIYRILTNLETKNVIQKHNFNNEQATYELVIPNEHHDHIICVSCNKVVEFMDDTIEQLQNKIALENNFHILHHSLNIYGICTDCDVRNDTYQL